MPNYEEFSALRAAVAEGHPTWQVESSFGQHSCWITGPEGRRTLLLAASDWEEARNEECMTAVFVGTPQDFVTHGGLLEKSKQSNRHFFVLPGSEAVFGLLLDSIVSPTGESASALDRARYEKNLLLDIGRALGQEKDIHELLDLLVTRAREITGADAGSVYVVKEGENEEDRKLQFIEAQNSSRVVEFESEKVEMALTENSIVGACVLGKAPLNIADLYNLPAPGTEGNKWGFIHDRTFDRRYDYQTRSMLTLPIISARGDAIGVMQLINKKRNGVSVLSRAEQFEKDVIPFDSVSVQLAKTVANQAGLALENALLYQEVQTMFDGFVRASVTAIESRDPTTSGHSMRVADLTVTLAKVVGKETTGAYADFELSEDELKQTEYAALLHDFGKVGVREGVLVKAQKLYHHERQIIESRFEFIRRSLEAEQLGSKVKYLLDKTRDTTVEALQRIDTESAERLKELDEFMEFIMQANRPTVLEKESSIKLEEIASRTYTDLAGTQRPYLTAEETRSLQIARGSLTTEERREIENHVVHTMDFLRRIPWGKTYRSVPKIAGSHHEKLDGTGYPNQLTADEIPTPSKIMTIADIFDALTASDRPYKRAVPLEKALDILNEEAGRGKVDSDLLKTFLDAKVYRVVQLSS